MRGYELKLRRANEHLEALSAMVTEWLETDAYTIESETDPQTRDTVCRASVKAPPPDDLSLVIGDAVQNLRSALDHIVYYLAERELGAALTPAIETKLMFPIAGNENASGEPADGRTIFKNAVDSGKLTGVPDDALTFIESEQPFRWGGGDDYRYHWLWTLHHLNRIDKHRRLALTTAWLDMPVITVPEGVTPRVKWWRAEGPIEDGDVVVRYSGAEVGVNAHFGRAVAIDEDVATRNVEILRGLVNVQDRVRWIIAVLLHIDAAPRP